MWRRQGVVRAMCSSAAAAAHVGLGSSAPIRCMRSSVTALCSSSRRHHHRRFTATAAAAAEKQPHQVNTGFPPSYAKPVQGINHHEHVTCRPTPAIPKDKHWDVIIVGGGHNGLTCAAYLAEQGLSVCVLERRYKTGGAAITEEINPGFHYSRASYLYSLFRPSIVEELQLEKHGLTLLPREPSSFTPMLDGRYLLMGADHETNLREIGKFSQRDAKLYPMYEEHLTKLTTFIEPYLDDAPPELFNRTSLREWLSKLPSAWRLFVNAIKLGPHLVRFHEILTGPATRILDRWFESEPLKATLGTDAVIGAMTSPSTPGSGYVLFHHVMGEVNGVKGSWAYVEGGMGAVSDALRKAAIERGAEIFTNAPVRQIQVDDTTQTATGVVLADGTLIQGSQIVSNATPEITFQRLIRSESLPAHYRRHIEHLDKTSPVCKINLSLDKLPDFTCMPNIAPNVAGPHHRGTIHFVETLEQIEQGYREALSGRPSSRPVIEMTLPSVLDSTLAPPGKHVAGLFVQYAPYHINGKAWTRGDREDFAQTCFGVIEEYCPGFTKSILHADVLTPCDLERVFGLTGGNIFHHSMGLDQLFWLRPVAGWARHRAPIHGLYLCGAGTHPGGGVMGSPGRNAARVIAKDAAAVKKARENGAARPHFVDLDREELTYKSKSRF